MECGVPLEHRDRRRVKVKAVFPYGSDWVPAGMAFITTLERTGNGEREVRLRAAQLADLHENPLNQYGAPRRSGYLLETAYPEWQPLWNYGSHEHAVRRVPSDSFKDMAEAACGGRWRIATYKPDAKAHPRCPRCEAALESFLSDVETS